MKFFILACSICFGDPSSASSEGVTAAVLFLMGVAGVVLAGVVSTLFVWARRARQMEHQNRETAR